MLLRNERASERTNERTRNLKAWESPASTSQVENLVLNINGYTRLFQYKNKTNPEKYF